MYFTSESLQSLVRLGKTQKVIRRKEILFTELWNGCLGDRSFPYLRMKLRYDVSGKSNDMDAEGYKNVLMDGPPTEDGSYLVILKDEDPIPQLLVRYTKEDGSHLWSALNRSTIQDDRILLYKRILITPDRKS